MYEERVPDVNALRNASEMDLYLIIADETSVWMLKPCKFYSSQYGKKLIM